MSGEPPGYSPPPGAIPPPSTCASLRSRCSSLTAFFEPRTDTVPGYILAFRLPDSIYFSTVASFVLVGVIVSLSISYISRYGLARGKLEQAHKLLVAVMVSCCLAKLGLDIKRVWDAVSALFRCREEGRADEKQVARTGGNPFDGELTATLVMIFVPTVLAQMWLLYRLWAVS